MASSLSIALLLLCLLAFTFLVQPAKAESNIIRVPLEYPTIQAAVNAANPGDTIFVYNGTYKEHIIVNKTISLVGENKSTTVIDGNFTGNCVVLAANNITITGFTVQNSGSDWDCFGIAVGSDYCNITGNIVRNNYFGIGVGILARAHFMQISKNYVTNNKWFGIDLYYGDSANSSVFENEVVNNEYGMDGGSSTSIFRNDMANNGGGVGLYLLSSNVNIYENKFVNDGLVVYYSYFNTVSNNTVNDQPLVYLEDKSNQTVKTAGQVILINCSNIIIEGLNLSATCNGVERWGTNNTSIFRNTMMNNGNFGINLHFSSGNSILENNLINNEIYLYKSSNNTISRNNITGTSGIQFDSSSWNCISSNNITNGDMGIWLHGSSNYNCIFGNVIANNIDGLELSSDYNVLCGNTIMDNKDIGVWYAGSYCKFFHNNFVRNKYQVSVWHDDVGAFDDGYPSGGNYWSDYRTTYPNAAENDSSGIWDTPYIINTNNTDRYPLMGPFGTFGVGIWNGVAYSVSIVSNSTLSNSSFNPTLKTLTFNVTGTNGTVGFCRVAIPKMLMSCTNSQDWIVTVNGTSPLYLNLTTDSNYTYIFFNYTHSTETVQITSTSAVPEFQPFLLLLLFMIITLLGVIVLKSKRRNVKRALDNSE